MGNLQYTLENTRSIIDFSQLHSPYFDNENINKYEQSIQAMIQAIQNTPEEICIQSSPCPYPNAIQSGVSHLENTHSSYMIIGFFFGLLLTLQGKASPIGDYSGYFAKYRKSIMGENSYEQPIRLIGKPDIYYVDPNELGGQHNLNTPSHLNYVYEHEVDHYETNVDNQEHDHVIYSVPFDNTYEENGTYNDSDGFSGTMMERELFIDGRHHYQHVYDTPFDDIYDNSHTHDIIQHYKNEYHADITESIATSALGMLDAFKALTMHPLHHTSEDSIAPSSRCTLFMYYWNHDKTSYQWLFRLLILTITVGAAYAVFFIRSFFMSEDGTEDNNGNMNINASALPPLTTAEASSLIPSNNLSNLSRHNDYQVPTMTPTLTPLASPSEKSTYWPSFFPTLMPWSNPSRTPSYTPSASPSEKPTYWPSFLPTLMPWPNPSRTPSYTPSASPSTKPTYWPSFLPTSMPWPSLSPINAPTQIPSLFFTPSPPPPVFTPKSCDDCSRLAGQKYDDCFIQYC